MKPGDEYLAMVYPGPDQPLTQEHRVVGKPGAGEVLVRLRGSSLNYHDVMVANGIPIGVTFPRVPSCDGCGEIIAAGPDVQRVAVGDRVVPTPFPDWQAGPENAPAKTRLRGDQIDGCLRQAAIFAESELVEAPAHLSDVEAATLCGAGITAWRSITVEGDLQPGEIVVLQGTGGVSVFGLQLAKMRGAIAIMTSSSDAKLERVRELGADHTINYREQPDWAAAVLDLTAGKGADLVLDVAGSATLDQSLKAVRYGGRVITLGGVGGFDAVPLAFGEVIARNLCLKGVSAGSRADLEALSRAYNATRMRPVVDVQIEMTEVSSGLEQLARGEHLGKIGVVIN